MRPHRRLRHRLRRRHDGRRRDRLREGVGQRELRPQLDDLPHHRDDAELLVHRRRAPDAVGDVLALDVETGPGEQVRAVDSVRPVAPAVERLALISVARPRPVGGADLVEAVDVVGGDLRRGPVPEGAVVRDPLRRRGQRPALRRVQGEVRRRLTLERGSRPRDRDASDLASGIVAAGIDVPDEPRPSGLDRRQARDLHPRHRRLVVGLESCEWKLHDRLRYLSTMRLNAPTTLGGIAFWSGPSPSLSSCSFSRPDVVSDTGHGFASVATW